MKADYSLPNYVMNGWDDCYIYNSLKVPDETSINDSLVRYPIDNIAISEKFTDKDDLDMVKSHNLLVVNHWRHFNGANFLFING